jgi:hypothetical protein
VIKPLHYPLRHDQLSNTYVYNEATRCGSRPDDDYHVPLWLNKCYYEYDTEDKAACDETIYNGGRLFRGGWLREVKNIDKPRLRIAVLESCNRPGHFFEVKANRLLPRWE